MNAEQFGRLMAELQEIKSLLAGKAEQEANEPVLRWFKSSWGNHWWAGPCMNDFESAMYVTDPLKYYPGGGEEDQFIIGRDVPDDLPLAVRVGVILGHAAANGIRVEPFPWHLVNKEE